MPRNHSPAAHGSKKSRNRNSMPGPGGPPMMMGMPGEFYGGGPPHMGGPPPNMGGPPPNMSGHFYNQPPPHMSGAPPPPQHYHQTPPAAPPAPNSGQPTPYSTQPPSPTSSAENLHYGHPPPPGQGPGPGGYYPQFPSGPPGQFPGGPPGQYPPGPPGQFPPGPPGPMQHFPAPSAPAHMRPGANGELGRRNTAATSRPYEREPELGYSDYHNQRPVIHSHSSSSAARPDSDDSGPYMVMPAGGRRGPIYRPGSNFSESSFDGPPEPRAPREQRYHGGSRMAPTAPSSGSGAPHRRADSREYQQMPPRSQSDRNLQGAVYHTERAERPPRRPSGRTRSISRPPPAPGPPGPGTMSDYEDWDPEPEPAPRSQRRLAAPPSERRGPSPEQRRGPSPNGPPSHGPPSHGPPSSSGTTNGQQTMALRDPAPAPAPAPSMSGALVRARSPPTPSGSGGQLIRRAPSEDELSEPTNQNIRIEVGGQAINLSFSGNSSGKSGLGNITINTTRTVTVPDEPAPPPQKALPAPEPAPPTLPPNVQATILPPPPPPLSQHQLTHQLTHHAHESSDSDNSPPPSHARDPYPPNLTIASPPADAEQPLWTKISRDIVSKRAVLIQGYEFEEADNAIIIYRVLVESEIDELVDLSEQIRSGKLEVVRKPPPRRSTSQRRRRRRSSSASRRSSRGGAESTMSGPGPSRSRPPPGKPAIVQNNRNMPEAPPPPSGGGGGLDREDFGLSRDGRGPPPVEVVQTKGVRERALREEREERERAEGLRENPEMPGTYVGYRRNPPGPGRRM